MNRSTLIIGGVLAALAIVILLGAAFKVRQTQQALILQFGNPVRVEREPGLKFKIPVVQNVEFFDKRILDLDPPVQEVLLSDQKRIGVDSFARYRIVDPLLFFQRATSEANFRQIFGSRINSVLRSEIARNGLSEILSPQRDDIMRRIADDLRRQAPDFGVELIDLRIGRTDLPEATSQAVYSRMRSARVAQAAQLRAEGEQLKAKIQAEADRERTVLLADANRQAQVLRGEGEAERTRILNEAYGRDPNFFDFFRSLEAYASIGGDKTTMVLTPDSDFFRFFLNEGGGKPVAPVPEGKGRTAATP